MDRVKQPNQYLLIATIQILENLPGSAWKPLIRTLWSLFVTLSALFTPDAPRQLILAAI